MARTYKRDKLGRFAGSGSISTSTRATTTGARARRNAKSMKQEQAGQKERKQYMAKSARSSMRYRAELADSGSTAGAKSLGNSARLYGRKSNQSRQKSKTMERERRSLLRRGSMRGGG